jgi:hypothetical protein
MRVLLVDKIIMQLPVSAQNHQLAARFTDKGCDQNEQDQDLRLPRFGFDDNSSSRS